MANNKVTDDQEGERERAATAATAETSGEEDSSSSLSPREQRGRHRHHHHHHRQQQEEDETRTTENSGGGGGEGFYCGYREAWEEFKKVRRRRGSNNNDNNTATATATSSAEQRQTTQVATTATSTSTSRTAAATAGAKTRVTTTRLRLHAHFDCFSGAAGDMMLAACFDAAGNSNAEGDDGSDSSASPDALLLRLVELCLQEGLPPLKGEFVITCRKVWRGGIGSIGARHVAVRSAYRREGPAPVPSRCAPSVNGGDNVESSDEAAGRREEETSKEEEEDIAESSANPFPQHHDHVHHSHSHAHSHSHSQKHAYSTCDSDTTVDTATPTRSSGPLRNLPEIRAMLLDAPAHRWIPTWVRDTSVRVFTELAEAEAAVHRASGGVDAVHFHEVGAVDSIVDTVGTLLALYFLEIETFSCSRLPLGEGYVRTAHGVLPVPAPATLRLMIGMPVTRGPPGWTGELVTPTAAALLRVLTDTSRSLKTPRDGSSTGNNMRGCPPPFTLRYVGVGAGTKDFDDHPNILRLLIGEGSKGSN